MKMVLSLIFTWLIPSVTAQPINVMTYNIRYDNPADGVNQWNSRKEKVFDLLKKYAPDILGVQEALHHQITDIVGDKKKYTFVGVGRDDGKQKGEYSAILYKTDRFEIMAQNTFWLSESPDVPGSKSWDAAITRVATWAKFRDRLSHKEFFVINTHFDHIGKDARKKSAALLKSKAELLSENLPVIIMGDFNCTREEEPYHVMMTPAGLKLADTAPKNVQGTFCSFEVNSIVCRPIDYIFHSHHMTTENYTVIKDNDGKYYPSDHLPVMAKLIFSE